MAERLLLQDIHAAIAERLWPVRTPARKKDSGITVMRIQSLCPPWGSR